MGGISYKGNSQNVFNRIVLSKESSTQQIKAYFEAVLKLYESKENYPVNLDDVWPLVYAAKNKAVRALRNGFYENDDFITVTRNGQGGKFSTTEYYLSVKCFEYFIAKKVREVFDVYREVFKQIATGEVKVVEQPKSGAEMLLLYAQQMVEQEKRLASMEGKQNLLEQKIENIEQRTATNISYTTIVGFANRFGIRCPIEQASVLGKKSANICKKFGYNMGRVPDPRFGMVRTYPDDVLFEVFSEAYPNINFKK